MDGYINEGWAVMDVEAVANGLTDAQRHDMIEGNCCYMGNPSCLCNSPELAALYSLGLLVNRHPSGATLSPDGLAVRDYLERQ